MLAIASILISSGASLASDQPRSYQQRDIDVVAIVNEVAETLGWSNRALDDEFPYPDVYDETYLQDENGEGFWYGHGLSVYLYDSYEDAERYYYEFREGAETNETDGQVSVSDELFHELNGYRFTRWLEWEGQACSIADAQFKWTMGNMVLTAFEHTTCTLSEPPLDPMPIAEALYAAAIRHGLEANPISPNPSNLDPNSQDIEAVIEQINKIVNNPAVPITGAIAGTLLAMLIAALRGGPPTPVRNLPPTGRLAPTPGQVDANGRVYSPVSGGWVSPQMYEYHKNWSDKGWRWNSQAGRFEGQHGAINEKGQVMDDEWGWVDQKTFKQNELMRSEGMVYNRNLGWQTPEDLNRFESEREGIRQRGREFSAEKNAQIQRELKESQAQRDRAFQEKMRKIDAKRTDEIKADMEMYQKRAQRYIDRDKQLANYVYIAEKVETAADVGVAVCARLTGPVGKTIAAAYEGVKEAAVSADEVIASDDKIGTAEGLGDEKIKDEYKEKIKEKVEEKITSYVPKSVNRWMKKITNPIKKLVLRRFGKPGLILYQELEKKAVEMAKEKGEEFVEEQIEAGAEIFINGIDPNVLTGT